MSENRLDLLPRASCDLGLKSLDGCIVPLSSPPSRHKGRLVGYGEKTLKAVAQLLHRTRGKATDGHCEVQAARSPRARRAGAVAEHVGLVPEPATDGTGAYLWVGPVIGIQLRWCPFDP